MGAVESPLTLLDSDQGHKNKYLEVERVDAHRFRCRYSGILLVGSVQDIDPPLQFPDSSSQSMNFCACKEKRSNANKAIKTFGPHHEQDWDSVLPNPCRLFLARASSRNTGRTGEGNHENTSVARHTAPKETCKQEM
jgi:hypothetical protein